MYVHIGKTYNVILHLLTVWLFSRWSKPLWCLKHARILGDEVVCITAQNQPPSPCTAYGETTLIPRIMRNQNLWVPIQCSLLSVSYFNWLYYRLYLLRVLSSYDFSLKAFRFMRGLPFMLHGALWYSCYQRRMVSSQI